MRLNRRHTAGLFLVLVAAGVSLFLEASAKQTAGVVVLGIAAAWAFGSLSLRMLGLLSCVLVCAVGLGILGVPVWQDWNLYRTSVQDYDSAISELRQSIAKADVWEDVAPYGKSGGASKKPRRQGEYTDADIDQPQPKPDIFDQVAGEGQKQNKFPPGFIPDADVNTPGKSVEKDVKVPEGVQKWVVRVPTPQGATIGSPTAWDEYGNPIVVAFPARMSDEDIMHVFVTKMLVNTPSFSIWASIKSHRATSLSGTVLVVCGLLGSAWLFWWKRRPIHEINIPTS